METGAVQDNQPGRFEPQESVVRVRPAPSTGHVSLDAKVKSALDDRMEQFIQGLLAAKLGTESLAEKVRSVDRLGNGEIQASASVSRRIVERPMRAMRSGLFDEDSAVSRGLAALHRQVEALDPGRQGDLLVAPRKLFGPFFQGAGNRLEEYFQLYHGAQVEINETVEALLAGKDDLHRDNIAIEEEQANLWGIMQKLEQFVYITRGLDAYITLHLPEIERQGAEKARLLKEEFLFALGQKQQELLTQLAVTSQGYLALNLIRKNNLELIKAVDRATTTTLSTLRTAILVAQGLTSQQLVLDRIRALNSTAANLAGTSAKLLDSQSPEMHEEADKVNQELDQLKNAFAEIYESLEDVAVLKGGALASLHKTVNVLSSEVERSAAFLKQLRQEELRA